MSDELKTFVLGLQQSQKAGHMEWYGTVPEEVYELFGLNRQDSKYHLNVMGVHVEVKPRFSVKAGFGE